MATIFTRAKAVKKVIELFDVECGISKSKVRCNARLESDLGIVGADTYALLEAMQNDGVDMSNFDCSDRISPEGLEIIPGLIFSGLFTLSYFGLLQLYNSISVWVLVISSLVVSCFALGWICRLFPAKQHEELRVRDLVLSFEAGHWVSPKAEQKSTPNH